MPHPRGGAKILGQAGIELADIYDVEGSVAGIDRLLSEDVNLVHEMGAEIFSSRFQATIRRSEATYAQNVAIVQALTDLPETPVRIHGVDVMTDDASRVASCFVSLRTNVGTVRDFPIWNWGLVSSLPVTLIDDGTLTALSLLVPLDSNTHQPSMLSGTGQSSVQNISEIVVRGGTTAFGAGTVDIILLVHISFAADPTRLSSKGLPIPSW